MFLGVLKMCILEVLLTTCLMFLYIYKNYRMFNAIFSTDFDVEGFMISDRAIKECFINTSVSEI